MMVLVTNGAEKRLCEVTNLFDRSGDEVDDPTDAHSAVIKWDDDHWIALHADPGDTIDSFIQRAT